MVVYILKLATAPLNGKSLNPGRFRFTTVKLETSPGIIAIDDTILRPVRAAHRSQLRLASRPRYLEPN